MENSPRSTVLLPGYDTDDLCANLTAARAVSILAAWLTAWHPKLIFQCGLPSWRTTGLPPTDLPAGSHFFIPAAARDQVPSDWLSSESAGNVKFVEQLPPAENAFERGLQTLGLARLQMELLWQRMRHSGQLDQDHFAAVVIAAAKAALANDAAKFNEDLTAACEMLNQSRRHFYPVEFYLIDLTVVATSTLGDGLRRQLETPGPQNFLISGETLQALAQRQPDTLALLRAKVSAGQACVVGGEFAENELPLLPREAVLSNFRAGDQVYRKLLGKPPTVFGRRRAGLSPLLPALLASLGYHGALHFTLDDGRFPVGEQAKIRWESPDYSAISALARPPRRADDPCAVLQFADDCGHALDHDHVATLVYAHWPGQTDDFYVLLREFGERSSALGSWMTLDEYFQQTDYPTRSERFHADEYEYPYFRQQPASADPVESIHTQCVAGIEQETLQMARVLGALVKPGGIVESNALNTTSTVLTELRSAIPRAKTESQSAVVAFNTNSYPRVIATADRAATVVTPPLGFAWQSTAEQPVEAVHVDLANRSLKNEFFTITLHPERGGMSGCFLPLARGSLCSQQLAVRLNAQQHAEPVYSQMMADAIELGPATPLVKSLIARGKLLGADGGVVASFRQQVEVTSQSRLVVVQGEIELTSQFASFSAAGYCACLRTAWHDEGASLYRSLAGIEMATEATWIESPEFILMQTTKARLGLIAGGFAFHQRMGSRTLDTFLARGKGRSIPFRVGITVDHPCPAGALRELLGPDLAAVETASPPWGHPSAWLLQVGAPSVLITGLELIPPSEMFPSGGLRVRLLETRGESIHTTLNAARGIVAARQYNFSGEPQVELNVEDDKIRVELGSSEWVEIWIAWK